MSDRFSHRRASAFVSSGRFSNGRPFGAAKHFGKNKHGRNQKQRNHTPPRDALLDRYFNPPATDR